MADHNIFRGLITALITPFNAAHEVDYDALKRLLHIQITNNVDSIIICSTTGESPTLSKAEKIQIIRFIVSEVNNKMSIIVATGSNNTEESAEFSKEVCALGVDGLILVTPYYNKPTQQGLYTHLKHIANSVHLPIMLYNVPSRTGVMLAASTVVALSQDCDNITAIKESSGNLEYMMRIIQDTRSDFSLLAGDDIVAYPYIALGANGLVSVMSNAFPQAMKLLIDYSNQGDFAQAKQQHYKLLHAMRSISQNGTNPMAIKYILHKMSVISNELRLPMVPLASPLSIDNKDKTDTIASLDNIITALR